MKRLLNRIQIAVILLPVSMQVAQDELAGRDYYNPLTVDDDRPTP